jgi:GTP cyclohydrolase I
LKAINYNRPTHEQVMEAVRTFIIWAGDNPDREGMKDTPKRVVAALEEVFESPEQIKDKAFLRKIFGTSPDTNGFEKYKSDTIQRIATREQAIDAMETLARWVGYDGADINTVAQELLQGFSELVVGLEIDVSKIYQKTFSLGNNGNNGPVLLKNIPLVSLCEHHLFGFKGVVHIAYIPGLDENQEKHVVGLSKLARATDARARRFQIQEGLTTEIAQDLMDNLKPHPKAVAVVIEASHGCMQNRGVRSTGTKMVTSHILLNETFAKSQQGNVLSYADKIALKSLGNLVLSGYQLQPAKL